MDRHEEEIGGVQTVWYEEETRTSAPVLFVHGVPDHGLMWRPFLERIGGIAPDMPGFGESGKPAHFDYSITGYGDFLESFVDRLGLERFSIVVHDWGGGGGLELAMRRPDAVERLVLIDSVPLLREYRWHWLARVWRTPVVGELFMGASTKWAMRRMLHSTRAMRRDNVGPFLDRVWPYYDHGTQRAILKLYRSAPEPRLAEAGKRLGDVTAPALVLWGKDDIYLPNRLAQAYGDALGGEARVEIVDDAVHWIWLDRPEVVDTVAGFLSGGD